MNPESHSTSVSTETLSLNDHLAAFATCLNEDGRQKEAQLRPQVFHSAHRYKMDAEELGHVLLKYRQLYKQQRQWVRVAHASASYIRCDVRTLFRCIDRVEKPSTTPLSQSHSEPETERKEPISSKQEQLTRKANTALDSLLAGVSSSNKLAALEQWLSLYLFDRLGIKEAVTLKLTPQTQTGVSEGNVNSQPLSTNLVVVGASEDVLGSLSTMQLTGGVQ